MIHGMNCNDVQCAIDSAFDDGVAVSPEVAAHAATCRACAVYGDSLAALDRKLRLAPPVQPAPALVARIQAEIATQPRQIFRPWAFPVGVAAAILALAALGPVVSGYSWIPNAERALGLVQEPVLPEWGFVKQELMAIPVGVASDIGTLEQWSENTWVSTRGWLAAFGGGYSPWVWALFIVCGAAAFALDGMEWMSRPMNRTGR